MKNNAKTTANLDKDNHSLPFILLDHSLDGISEGGNFVYV